MSCTHPAFLFSTPIKDYRLKVKFSALGCVLADLSSLLTQYTSQTIISKQITGWIPSALNSGFCCPGLGGPSHGSVCPVPSSPSTSHLSMTGSEKLILGTPSSGPALLTSVSPSAFLTLACSQEHVSPLTGCKHLEGLNHGLFTWVTGPAQDLVHSTPSLNVGGRNEK